MRLIYCGASTMCRMPRSRYMKRAKVSRDQDVSARFGMLGEQRNVVIEKHWSSEDLWINSLSKSL